MSLANLIVPALVSIAITLAFEIRRRRKRARARRLAARADAELRELLARQRIAPAPPSDFLSRRRAQLKGQG